MGRRSALTSRLLVAAITSIAAIVLLARGSLAPPTPVGARTEPDAELAVRLQSLFSDLADRVRPAVVSIGSTERLPVAGSPQRDFLDRLFQEERELHRTTLGSGVVVDPRGYILTNSHVVGDGSDLRVRLWNNQRLPGQLIHRDEALDVALVKVDYPGLVAIPMGDSSKLRVGHWVIAVGSPFGLSHTVSVGIVSAVARSDIGILPYESFIQTDAAIHQGNSGGPLINLHGEVVGINTAIYSGVGGSNLGIGFAIPINLARALITRWIDGKSAAFLGVDTARVDEDVAAYFGLDRPRGAFVGKVLESSPAKEAGIRETDIILDFDGTPVRDVDHARVLIAQSDTGRPVPIEVFREGRSVTVIVNLVRNSSTPREAIDTTSSNAPRREILGVTVSTLNADVAGRLGLPGDASGVVVLHVTHDSPADNKGIRVGDVVTEVNETPVLNMRQFRDALRKRSDCIMMKIERRGRDLGYFFLRR